MRIGDPTPALPLQLPSGGLTPAQIAPMLNDEQATFLADIVDETNVGKHRKMMCYGIAGVAGLALGFVGCKLLGK